MNAIISIFKDWTQWGFIIKRKFNSVKAFTDYCNKTLITPKRFEEKSRDSYCIEWNIHVMNHKSNHIWAVYSILSLFMLLQWNTNKNENNIIVKYQRYVILLTSETENKGKAPSVELTDKDYL